VWVSHDLCQKEEKGPVYNLWVHSGAHRVNLTRHLERSRDWEVAEPRREEKTNHIPKGLVPLEKLFDSNYVLEKYSIQSQEHDVFNCNIGIVVDPKIIKLSKALSEKKKRKYVKLMRCLLIFFLGHMNTLIFFTLT
jgi:hypothetical protein